MYDGLIVWDEHTDQQVLEICHDHVISIKRILTTNSYIIKTKQNGLNLLTIKNLKNSLYSIQNLLEAKEEVGYNYTDSL